VGGPCYHVINRGNARAEVFHTPTDYTAFSQLLGEAGERVGLRVLAYCLRPNHFDLALRPRQDGELSQFMLWLLTSHVRRYHAAYHSSGHVWQGRYYAFPIQADAHLLTVLRTIERNPLRAGLVTRATDWRWSCAREWGRGPRWLYPGPVRKPQPQPWGRRVNILSTEAEVEALRHSVNRGVPFGTARWQRRTAERLGLEASLNPRGRPRTRAKK